MLCRTATQGRDAGRVEAVAKAKANEAIPLRTFFVVTVMILAAGAAGFGILLILPDYLKSASQTIVILLVAGFVSVTLLLYLGTIILRAAGLTTNEEALGMPEGSIRALIAMSLILMFAIIGVTVLYSGIGGEPVESKGITSAQLERLENVQIISISIVDPAASPGSERFNVTARPEISQAGHDYGLQLLTTVSTLVVAVAGFYFGSRAVNQGAKTATAAQKAAVDARTAAAGTGTTVADKGVTDEVEAEEEETEEDTETDTDTDTESEGETGEETETESDTETESGTESKAETDTTTTTETKTATKTSTKSKKGAAEEVTQPEEEEINPAPGT